MGLRWLQAGIGFATSEVQLDRLPGWDSHSYGYHGDDGCAFKGSGKGNAYGPTFTAGAASVTGSWLGAGAALRSWSPAAEAAMPARDRLTRATRPRAPEQPSVLRMCRQ